MALITCPECSRAVSNKAEKCVGCGYPIHAKAGEKLVAPEPAKHVRQGMTQAIENKDRSNLWVFQVFLAAGIAGIATTSWWVAGGTFLGLAVVAQIPVIGKLVGVALAALFGLVVYLICMHFEAPEAAGFVLGGIVFLGALGANFTMSQHLKDLQGKSEA